MTHTTSRSVRLLAAAAFAATPLTAKHASAAEEWALLAREGGCQPIASLKRRLPDLQDVRDPEGFQHYLKARGWQFTRRAHPVSPGKAVEFVVDEKGLALLFVTRELCKSP